MARDYYRLAWLDDGYPGQRRDDGTIWAHPIMPIYVLDDWLAQWKQQPSAELGTAIARVAHAAVSRMVEHEGTLIFWYDDAEAGARLRERHYSALTQGYYAVRLYKAGEILGDRSLRKAALRAFRALMVPVERQGVLAYDRHGISLAEVPQQPNSYILNGWQSALVSADEYHHLSGDPDALELVHASTSTMASLLPFYDAPDVANSRYGLTGFIYLRLLGEGRFRAVVHQLDDVDLPVPVQTPAVSRWQPYVVARDVDDGKWRNLRVNVVVSAAGRNRLLVDGGTARAVQAYVGRYDPLTAAPVDRHWKDLHSWRQEEGRIAIDVPDSVVAAAVHPTNFIKLIDGKHTNVYHAIHIRRLRQLHTATGLPELAFWADQWERAMCAWKDISLYAGLSARTPAGATVPVEDLCR